MCVSFYQLEWDFAIVCLMHVPDLSTAEEFRQQIPVFGQRRTDLYDTVEK
jgi:hypothetical protein